LEDKMLDFSWQQWIVAIFFSFNIVMVLLLNEVPEDYFHSGNKAARFIVRCVVVLALVTGGFWG
jgi:hypothetical protein